MTKSSTNNTYPAKLNRFQRQQTIVELHRQGNSLREISRLLKVSRNTVRKVIRICNTVTNNESRDVNEDTATGITTQSATDRRDSTHPIVEHLASLYRSAGGNGVRIQELAEERHGIKISYSTLTRILRNSGLREPAIKRSGMYHFEPGAEMQHDTSPHTIEIGGKKVKTQCAAAILPVSRYAFVQYYPCFTRFEIQLFLTEAILFFGGATTRCTIDNTSVALTSGSGPEAVIAPQIKAFGNHFGMTFIPHAVMHSDRKAQVERLFSYVEGNFIPGRHFESWKDLNNQARQWCNNVANSKSKRDLGTSPNIAFEAEKERLIPLPRYIPPVTRIEQRIVDIYGRAHLETNRYSVPERLIGKSVEVHKLAEEVVIFFNGKEVARHQRLIGERNRRSTHKGHHTRPKHYTNQKAPSNEETLLRGQHEKLDIYLDQLKSHLPGRGMQGMRRLLQMKRNYPAAPFISAIERAHHYGLFDLKRLEQLILEQVRGDFFQMGDE